MTGIGLQPGEDVTLSADGKTFKALADEQGSYSFFSPTIPTGPPVLSVTNRPDQSLTISPAYTRNLCPSMQWAVRKTLPGHYGFLGFTLERRRGRAHLTAPPYNSF